MKSRLAMLGLMNIGIAAATASAAVKEFEKTIPRDEKEKAARKKDHLDRIKRRDERLKEAYDNIRYGDGEYMRRGRGNKYTIDAVKKLRAERGVGRPPKKT